MAALVGGAFLSAFANVLIERMATPEFLSLFKTRKMNMGLLQELNILLNTINGVLDDAESQRITNPAVEKWLDELRDAAYEADDVLDFIASEAATAAKDEADLTTGNQILDLFTFRNPFKKASPQDHSEEAFSLGDVPQRMEGIVQRLQLLEKQIVPIGLREGAGREASKEASKQRATSSLVDESLIFGRDADTEAILKLLQEDDADRKKIGVIPIVGIGGIGKTTLAQLIYNDDRVAKLFECRVWVCVSDKYDDVRIKKEILEGVNNSSSAGICGSSLQQIDVELQQSLKDKKYLLVLDDIWDNAYDHWDKLLTPLKSGARGSKILITTRDQKIASKRGNIDCPYDLHKLDDDICWQIFEKHVFKGGKGGERLESIGRKIARKCSGLPLAAKMLGGLLCGSQDEEEWLEILESKTWKFLDDEVLPALRLSYQHLPSHLKQCFAYCAIFPKDYKIEKEKLIQLWMAEGFLLPPKIERETKKWGEKCFQELVSRSFFQKHTFEYGGGSYFLMHDLINDLAQLVSGEFSIRMDGGDSSEFNSRNRYFSFSFLDAYIFKRIDNIHKAKFLRTFCYLPVEYNLFDGRDGIANEAVNILVSRLRCLRVLSLRAYHSMTKLPDSIKHLKHLRYLDLARTDLERLPETVCTLYNLQTLILYGCYKLVELPENMGKLINLHFVDIRGAINLQKMPPGMGNLKHLMILSDFILGKEGCSDLNELGKLQYLQGALSVSNLQNVVNIPNNILKNKKELEDLELTWSGGSENSAHELSVLEQLQPYKSIKKLSIHGYGGTKFADWVGLSSYTNLVSLKLYGCENCFCLPPLGSLSNLEDLSISKFDAMVEVSMKMPFKSLKTLLIENMEQWENWFFCEENDHPGKCGSLAKLEKLTIKDCPKLKTILTSGPTHMVFYSLNSLIVEECPNFKISNLVAISNFKQLAKKSKPANLSFRSLFKKDNSIGLPIVILEQLPSAMYSLNVEQHKTERIEEMGVALDALEDVKIRESELCECIPLELFPVLKSLYVYDCPNLESLSASGEPLPQPLTSLASLKISFCKSLICFPKGGISAPNMTRLELYECENLKSLPEGMNVLLSSLKHLEISLCQELESFPEGGLPPNLQSLQIADCNHKLIDWCWQGGLQTLSALSSLKLINYSGDHLNCFPFPPALTSFEMRAFRDQKFISCKDLQHLTHLTIHLCPNLESFVQEGLASSTSALETESVLETQSIRGLLPNLQSLHISCCDELIGRRLQWSLQRFNTLSHLYLGYYSKDDLGSFPEESLLPSTLTSLIIEWFSNLKVINYKGLRHLTSLSQLEIHSCKRLRCLPEEGLPSSLSVLKIRNCRLLKERCEPRKGQDWAKISHISTIEIDSKTI